MAMEPIRNTYQNTQKKKKENNIKSTNVQFVFGKGFGHIYNLLRVLLII